MTEDAHRTEAWHAPDAAAASISAVDVMFLGALALLSLVCVAHMWWRHAGGPLEKLGLTVVTMVPVIGPLLYGSVYSRAGPPPRPVVVLPCARALPPRRPQAPRESEPGPGRGSA